MNVGASAPEEAGLYFSWGNNPGHTEGSGYDFSQEVYNETPGNAIVADLTLAEDMARQSMGTPWRMPSIAEFQELYDNCTFEWTEQNGVAGCLFTSRFNGNSIFLPAAGAYIGTAVDSPEEIGFYWSSSYVSAQKANLLYFTSDETNPWEEEVRFYGCSVRAVQG